MTNTINWNKLFSGDADASIEIINPIKIEEKQKSIDTVKENKKNTFNKIMYEINTIKSTKEDLNLLFPGGFSIDNIETILNYFIYEERNIEEVTEKKIAQILGLAISQGELYGNSLCYLGFLSKEQKNDDIIFLFTKRFWQYIKLTSLERSTTLFRSMIEHDTIKNCFYYCNRWSYVEKYKEIIEILIYDPNIRNWDEERLGIGRNARCIKNWYRWVEQNIKN